MVLRRICRVVQGVWDDFLYGVIHRWISASELTVQLLNTVGVIRDIKLAQANVLQFYSVLERLTFDAMTWKNECEADNRWKSTRMLPAVSTYFLFSRTPPHALIVKFVDSKKKAEWSVGATRRC